MKISALLVTTLSVAFAKAECLRGTTTGPEAAVSGANPFKIDHEVNESSALAKEDPSSLATKNVVRVGGIMKYAKELIKRKNTNRKGHGGDGTLVGKANGFDEQGADIRSDNDFLRDVASAVDVPYSTCVDCCDGEYACSGASGDISDNSCGAVKACWDSSADISYGSCNDDWACNGASATIGSGSCNAGSACYQSTGYIGDNACNVPDGCGFGEKAVSNQENYVIIPDGCPSVAALGTPDCKWETMYGIPCLSEAEYLDGNCKQCIGCCVGDDACYYASADISDWSCNDFFACYESSANIGSNSCTGVWACYQSTGHIGDNACTVRGGCPGYDGVIPDGCPSVAALGAGNCIWETMYGIPCLSEEDFLAGHCNSAENPTNAPTNAPTPNPTNAPTNAPTRGHVIAVYDTNLKVPRCASLGTSCSSGILLDGKATNIEPNPPNTLDTCTDGTSGGYHSDESIDSIKVSAVGGGQLRAGGEAEIEAVVWAWGDGSFNSADFYYTDFTCFPVCWTLIRSITPIAGPGLQTLKIEFTLPNSDLGTKGVRVNFRYQGIQSPCTGGAWDDVDDLVFEVAPSPPVEGDSLLVQDAGTKVTRKPKSVAPLKKRPEDHCAMVDDKDRCDTVEVCKWNENGKRCHPNPNPNSVIQSEEGTLG